MPETKTPSRSSDAIMNKVMPILLVQHNVASLGKARQEQKIKKLEGFVARAIEERGLTLKMVEDNLALGRPPHFVETGEV